MSIRPIAPAHIVRAITKLDPHFRVEWSHRRNNWTVMYHPSGRAPYMVMRVQEDNGAYRPLDARTVTHLRYLLWANRNPVKALAERIALDEAAHIRNLAREEDNAYQMGLDMYPAVDAFRRATGQAWSAKPRPHVAGFGAGQSSKASQSSPASVSHGGPA